MACFYAEMNQFYSNIFRWRIPRPPPPLSQCSANMLKFKKEIHVAPKKSHKNNLHVFYPKTANPFVCLFFLSNPPPQPRPHRFFFLVPRLSYFALTFMKYLYFIPCDWQLCINLMHCSCVKRNIVVRIFCQNIFFMNFNCWIDFLDRKRMGVYITNSATSPILHNEFHLNLAVPRCWEPPGHYLCTPEPGSPGCVISIEKRCETCERHERREENGEKMKISALYMYIPTYGEKMKISALYMYIPTPGFVDNGQVPSPLRMYPGGGNHLWTISSLEPVQRTLIKN